MDEAALDEAHRLRVHAGDQRAQAIGGRCGSALLCRRDGRTFAAAQQVVVRPACLAGRTACAQPAVAIGNQLGAGELIGAGDERQRLPCLLYTSPSPRDS